MTFFYFVDIEEPFVGEVQRHIIEPLSDGLICSFPYSDDNPNKQRVDAWIAEGNTLQEWQPALEPVIEETPVDSTEEEPVIEEETSDSTDEEPVTEDGN
jgi:hypothetical protein